MRRAESGAAALNMLQASPVSTWRGTLDLTFARRNAKTVLSSKAHHGPLLVQRAFYPEGDGVCHVLVLHPPGGVVGGDSLELRARIDSGAAALLTTPAAGKFYRAARSEKIGRLKQNLTVATDGVLEFLPQENIFFSGANAQLETVVMLARGAKFFGWDISCLGRPAADEVFARGNCRQSFQLWRDGSGEPTPLFIDTMNFTGNSEILRADFGLRGFSVFATLLAAPANEKMLHTARAAAAKFAPDDGALSATLPGEVLVCRALCASAEIARKRLAVLWCALRPLLVGRDSCPPRIWNT